MESVNQRSLWLRGCQDARRTLATLSGGSVRAPQQGTEDRQLAPCALSLALGLHATWLGVGLGLGLGLGLESGLGLGIGPGLGLGLGLR